MNSRKLWHYYNIIIIISSILDTWGTISKSNYRYLLIKSLFNYSNFVQLYSAYNTINFSKPNDPKAHQVKFALMMV